MNRVNKTIDNNFPPEVWECYAAMEKVGCEPVHTGRGEFTFEDIYWPRYMKHKPSNVPTETWISFAHMQRVNREGPGGSIAPLETWVMAGLCSRGMKLYCPTPEDYMTLVRTDISLPWSEYRQPYETFCVAVPPELYPDPLPAIPYPVKGKPDATIGHGYPGFVVGRLSIKQQLLSLLFFGTGENGRSPNYNVFTFWDDPAELIEDNLKRGEERNMPFDLPPEMLTSQYSAHHLTGSEARYIATARRAFVNACLLLTHYGCRDMGPANKDYHKRLTDSLAKKNLPDAARAANEKAVARIPRLYAIDQFIKLRERRELESAREPGSGDTVKVSPHWRRGHWAMQPYGPHNSLRKRIYRSEIFVGLGDADEPPDTTVTYR